MASNEYGSEEALGLLLAKLEERDGHLASQVRAAIDVGKDIQEREQAQERKGKQRIYRKTVRFTNEEALQVAMEVLRAYFVEQPFFVNSALDDFAKSGYGVPTEGIVDRPNDAATRRAEGPRGVGVPKEVEIELQTETQISKESDQMFALQPVSEEKLEQQLDQWQIVMELLSSKEN